MIVLGLVVVAALGTGGYLIASRRGSSPPLPSTVGEVTAPGVTSAPAPATKPAAVPAATSPTVAQPAERPPLGNPPATKIDGSLEVTLSTEEKAAYGFPKQWTIKRKVVTPETGSAYVTFEVVQK